MKKSLFLFVLAFGLGWTACQKEILPEKPAATSELPAPDAATQESSSAPQYVRFIHDSVAVVSHGDYFPADQNGLNYLVDQDGNPYNMYFLPGVTPSRSFFRIDYCVGPGGEEIESKLAIVTDRNSPGMVRLVTTEGYMGNEGTRVLVTYLDGRYVAAFEATIYCIPYDIPGWSEF